MLANAATPRTVGGDLGSLEELALGGDHACSRRSDGSIRCWGANTRGQMGVGTSGGEYATPNLAAIDEDGAPLSATRIVAGVDACCARTDDAVRCWGANAFGQLGDGTTLDRNAGVEVAF
jgi:alpha-tubulin suppressor-like RCC1 family protein